MILERNQQSLISNSTIFRSTAVLMLGNCILQSGQTALFIQDLSIYGVESKLLPHNTTQMVWCHDPFSTAR